MEGTGGDVPFNLTSRLIDKCAEQFTLYRRAIVTLLILFAILFISQLWSSGKISNQLNSWDLLPKPERLTELYFTNSSNLPAVYTPGQQQTVSFTVRDIEYRTTKYTYTINQTNNSTDSALTQGSFTLKQNQSTVLKIPITLVNQGNHSQIEVSLTYKGIISGTNNLSLETESIHYLVDDTESQQ